MPATSPTVLRSPLIPIVNAILAALPSYTGVASTDTHLWPDGDDLPPLPEALGGNQSDLTVQVGGPVPNEPIVEGSGRADTRLTRRITVTIRTRFLEPAEVAALTPAQQAALDLNDGHYVLQELVLDCLHLWAPIDKNKNELLVQPMRLVASAGGEGLPKFPEWWVSKLIFEIVYSAPLSQNRF